MNEIKLIIWDLDDTLWEGTLAEHEDVQLNPAVVARIQFLLDRGIVHSICSKNDFIKARKKLKTLGIYDLFIFPKISFEDKGLRIKKIIEQAQLRPDNVLFVDDNPFILREALFHNPKILTKLTADFMQEDVTSWGKNDPKRERLKHYKILEKKDKRRIAYVSKTNNEQAFLQDCHIRIQLTPVDMHDNEIDRIIELVNRSNQMNFTQSRIRYDYLFTLFELKNGINFKVRVKDRYGDYGVVGFICIVNNTLFHYVFSCRILGMWVESKLYQWLTNTYPNLKIPFNPSKLKQRDENLDFISVLFDKKNTQRQSIAADKKILVRGPCLSNAISFLLSEHYHVEEEIFSFFEYANLHFLRKNIESKHDLRFEKTLRALNQKEYQLIVNFLESDYYSGQYLIKNKPIPIASNYIYWRSLRHIHQDSPKLGAHIEQLMIDGIRDIKKFNLSDRFSPWPHLEKFINLTVTWFGERWRKILYKFTFYFVFKKYDGYVSNKQFEENLLWYIGLFPENVQLIFINPPEKIMLPFLNKDENQKIIERTKTLNKITRKIAQEKNNVKILEMDETLEQSDIIDSFSHLKRQGYIKLSQSLLNLAKSCL